MKKLIIGSILLMSTLTASNYFIKVKPTKSSGVVENILRDWQPTASEFTVWQDVGSAFDFSGYLPVANTQTSDFTQTESYKQKQERYEQKREYDNLKGDYKDVGQPILHEQDDIRTNQRTVNVSNSGWVATSGYYNCTSYSPARSTVDMGVYFYQYRDCKKDYERTYTYQTGSTIIHTRNQTTTSTETQSRRTTGTKDTSIAATYGCPYGWTESSNSNRCYTNTVPLNSDGSCPSGYTITNAGYQCANYINMSYHCPSGYYLSGTRCYPK